MKNIFKIITAVVFATITLNSCTDNEVGAVAMAPTDGSFFITPNVTNVVLNKVDAEKQTAITFNWDKQFYGVNTPVTYTFEMDSNGGDFSAPVNFVLTTNQKSFTHADLNYYALVFKLVPNVQGQIKVRLKINLSYGALPSYSNVETIKVTPFETLNLKYPMPAQLYLQGDAVPSNWGTPVTDIQKMIQIDNHRFGLIIALTGGKNFAIISSPTNWSDPAYVTLDNNANPQSSGTFEPRGSTTIPAWGGTPIKSPAVSGVYQVILDFTEGTYTITPAYLITSPGELYLIGDATTNGWAAPGNAQKFTKIDDYTFTLTTTLKAGKFAFINANSTWSDPAYLGRTNSEPSLGGNIIPSGAANSWAGYNITAPNPGTYTITVNFKSGTYILTL